MLSFMVSCFSSFTPDMNPKPGMSMMLFSPHLISCGFSVTPGLFPIFRFLPVSVFMVLDFPTFDLPMNTIFAMAMDLIPGHL